jgi:DnaJ-like protein
MKDYYAILEVKPEANLAEIQKSYHKLAFKYHPDKSDYSKSRELFSAINEAYSVLSNPEKKKKYDLLRSGGGGENKGIFGPTQGKTFYQHSVINPESKKYQDRNVSFKPHRERGLVLPYLKYTRQIVRIGAIISIVFLLDFILPERVTKENIIQIQETFLELSNGKRIMNDIDIIHTKEGSQLMVSALHQPRLLNLDEINVCRTFIFSRFYKITISDWPYVIEARKTYHKLLLFIVVVLSVICGIGVFRKSGPEMEFSFGVAAAFLMLVCFVFLLS